MPPNERAASAKQLPLPRGMRQATPLTQWHSGQLQDIRSKISQG